MRCIRKRTGCSPASEGSAYITYASRALTDADARYVQIEKELLAVVYDLKEGFILTLMVEK